MTESTPNNIFQRNLFRYHADILSRFPNVCGGFILADGVTNGPSPEALQQAFFTEQNAVLARLGGTAPSLTAEPVPVEQISLSEIPSLAAWRAAFRAFGVNPTKYRSAAEALLRRLTKKGDIPSINTLVDVCNLVSIRYALPVAAFDLRAVQGAITVQFSDGSESFTPHDLGGSERVTSAGTTTAISEATQIEHPELGEVIFCDEIGRVLARRWCWKQSLESTVRPDTRQALFTIEAQHPGGGEDVESALNDLLALLHTYAGGETNSGVL